MRPEHDSGTGAGPLRRRLGWATSVVVLALLLSSCSSSSGDQPGSTPDSQALPSASSVSSTPTTPSTTSTCSYPAGRLGEAAAAWQRVVQSRQGADRQRQARRYRTVLTRIRGPFVTTCPDVEAVFDQVFVDAQFLVGYKGSPLADTEYDDLAANADALLARLDLQDTYRFVTAECVDAPTTDPSCQSTLPTG